jgi:hypothetical protein
MFKQLVMPGTILPSPCRVKYRRRSYIHHLSQLPQLAEASRVEHEPSILDTGALTASTL